MNERIDSNPLRIQRKRLGQIFSYLEALNQVRNPVKRIIGEQPWTLWLRDLPNHPSIEVRTIVDPEDIPEENEVTRATYSDTVKADYVMKVRRPKLTNPPSPPKELRDWLNKGWEVYEGEVSYKESINVDSGQGETVIESFADDYGRVQLFNEWHSKREEWQVNERPARQAMVVFENLYDLYTQLEREGELLELVLGDGILNWRRKDGDVYHPVLLQRLQIQLNSDIPEIALFETDHPVELYSALFRTLSDVDARQIGRCRDELNDGFYHPLAGDLTSKYLKRLAVALSPHGELQEAAEPTFSSEYPAIARNPVVFIRKRTLGYADVLEKIRSDIETREDFPPSLLDIVGLHGHIDVVDDLTKGMGLRTANEDEDILFSKAANNEQLQIAKRLNRYNSVLVQGPPGTGKSHTIANLVGHLLAQGKSVLITSYATKALRVLRDHVVDELRPLCVSVLDRDADSRTQLEGSITTMVEKLAESPEQFEEEAQALRKRRGDLINEIQEIRRKTLSALQNEYRSISVDGESITPSAAAKIIADGANKDDWIPGPIMDEHPHPLMEEELGELYLTNTSITPADETELRRAMPPLEILLYPKEFNKICEAMVSLRGQCIEDSSGLWTITPEDQDIELLISLEKTIIENTALLNNGSEWTYHAIEAGRKGGIDRQAWEYIVSLSTQLDESYAYIQEIILRYKPKLSEVQSIEAQYKIFSEIIDALGDDASIGKVTRLTHKDWRRTLSIVRVLGREPRDTQEVNALREYALYVLRKKELAERWNYYIASRGGPRIEEFGDEFERACLPLCSKITEALDWYQSVWIPTAEEISRAGISWDALTTEIEAPINQHSEISQISLIVNERLLGLIEARKKKISLNELEQSLRSLEQRVVSCDTETTPASAVRQLIDAIRQCDGNKYRVQFEEISRLHSMKEMLERRSELLDRLDRSASKWADMVRKRQAPHDKASPPGSPRQAWRYLQIKQELDRRLELSIEELQAKEHLIAAGLQRITGELISKQAWAKQIKRTEHSQRQALVGWLQTVKKIGKGTGKRVPRLRADARRLMNESRSAVPVWIMPLTRVAESFDPLKVRFDVVIIDEASQSDVLALIALYMGKQVIIVGDDKQVSPEAVGQRVEEVQALIDEHLSGIPNANLYDGQTSIYDLALQSFGGNITLLEHFRCAPDIINFSNYLCYEGAIKPLRDASKINLRPFVVPYFIEGACSEKKVNEKEALELASLLVAATQHEDYADKTFGVISMVGEEQAREIERILRTRLSPREYERRRLLCGNPAHFQGDERDVVFISMVDAPESGPLRFRNDDRFKKRFNVAASRAKDQMWVVHSLDPDCDLKPGDLRRELIRYALDPSETLNLIEAGKEQTESEFERQVYNRLILRGYKVIPQYRVGFYRIDLVVEGDGNRRAVECDGDRFHPIEKLEEDMARQAVLERLGWSFIRIRGTEYFQDPEKTIEKLCQHLSDAGIFPHVESAQSETTIDETELLDSVKRTAAILRHEWQGFEPEVADKKIDTGDRKEKTYAAPVFTKNPDEPAQDKSVPLATEVEAKEIEPKPVEPIVENTAKPQLPLYEDEHSISEPKARPGENLQLMSIEHDLESSPKGKDPIYDSIASILPKEDWNCPQCGQICKLFIGRHGPFFACSSEKCQEKRSVDFEMTKAAVENLHLICEVCGSPCSIKSSRFGPFIGCSKYPKCTHTSSIKAMRKRLMDRENYSQF